MNYKCPHCGASEAAEILYGMPAFSAELETSMKNGEVFIGGCCISGEMPKYKQTGNKGTVLVSSFCHWED